MRIISKFKDYYDSASAYGVDVEKIYVRDTKTSTIPVIGDWWNSSLRMEKYDIIGFCGEIYPIYNAANQYDDPTTRKERILYGDDAMKFKSNLNWQTISKKEPFFIEDEYYKDDYDYWDTCRQYEKLVKNEILKSIFTQHSVPVFHIKSNAATKKDNKGSTWEIQITLNPNLKDLCFFKVKDSVQAFSEIHQFLDVIQSQDTQVDVPVGGNDVVGRSKGFDENSFRKEPTKKKYSKKSKTKKL